MIFITGDTHGDFRRFSTNEFPEQKEMTKDDFVIICGDFGGIWNGNKSEQYWIDWLSEKPFSVLFADGNHENFDYLYQFPVVGFYGGKAHKIRDNIYHLMRGYVFTIENKKFFVFGGGKSHDVNDGILDEKDYPSMKELMTDYHMRSMRGQMLRINHVSWWEQEMPGDAEYENGIKELKKNDFKVDYVISHSLPQSVVEKLCIDRESDALTEYFDSLLADGLDFEQWFAGHYHTEKATDKYNVLYKNIIRIN